jgi:acyl carrier protein
MFRMSLKQQLKELLVQELNIEDLTPEQIKDDDLLFGDKLGLDSIDAVEIVFFVEQQFGIAMKDMKEARPALQSVETLAAFIEARKAS